MSKNYVVYAYARDDGTFYYIGKGVPKRPYSCGKSVRLRAKCPKDKGNIIILHSGLDENTAFEYEKALILTYGRKDMYPEWGVLRNLTDGGEGSSGREYSVSTRRKIAEKRRGTKTPEDVKKKLSVMRRGEGNSFYGKKHSEESKKRMSESSRGKLLSAETKAKLSKHFSGPLNPHRKPKDWYHPEHGDFIGLSAPEIVEKFPNLCLSRQALNDLQNGSTNNYKGWRRLADKHTVFRPKNYKGYDWFHPDYGVERDLSPTDLAKKYSILRRSLSDVANGKRKTNEGWVCINPNLPK